MKVGYIGLGAMGAPLAQRLIGTYDLCVWDINTAAVAEFEKLGAGVASSAAELAYRCDVLMLCLPRTENVRQVIFGAQGLAQGLTPGKIIIDQTSGVPEQTRDIARQLEAKGVAMIDAPVAGGVAAARAGKVTIMVSGPDSAYQTVSPILHAISSNVFRCGERVGDGQAIKLVNNVMNAACRLATLEIVAMGRKSGLPLATLTDLLNKSTARNRITETMLPAIVEGRAATNFALPLMVKDVRQAIELGMNAGAPMPVSSIALGLLQTGVNTLGQDARLEDVVKLIESMAGTRLRDDAMSMSMSMSTSTAATAGRDELTVGYVGLGAMGAALVRRLMKFRKVQVFDVRPDIVRDLEADGAVAASDLPSLARDCDVIMICVPDSTVVREVVFGKGGVKGRPRRRQGRHRSDDGRSVRHATDGRGTQGAGRGASGRARFRRSERRAGRYRGDYVQRGAGRVRTRAAASRIHQPERGVLRRNRIWAYRQASQERIGCVQSADRV